jgi:uncharacterized protein with PQ loop repeat
MFKFNDKYAVAGVFLIFLIAIQIIVTEKYEYNSDTKKNDIPNKIWLSLTIILSIIIVFFTVLGIRENSS